MKPRAIIFFTDILTLLFQGDAVVTAETQYKQAAFAGGCFWCMEPAFEQLDGVVDVVADYTGALKRINADAIRGHTSLQHQVAVQT